MRGAGCGFRGERYVALGRWRRPGFSLFVAIPLGDNAHPVKLDAVCALPRDPLAMLLRNRFVGPCPRLFRAADLEGPASGAIVATPITGRRHAFSRGATKRTDRFHFTSCALDHAAGEATSSAELRRNRTPCQSNSRLATAPPSAAQGLPRR